MHDPIADMIIRLKNAQDVGKTSIVFPYSKMKLAVAEILQKTGYIKSTLKKGKKIAKSIEVELVYDGDLPKIRGVKRVSKFSQRIYKGAKDIFPVKQGKGMSIISTPQGILTDKEARKTNTGGEILFEIW
ncbi:MAG: 30S ribosomal protein S8 [Patescibacteria group bacterium]|nr:30S ribosomal protein S8 [bacterium]MDZ4240790.1 30S ribosomal protein S8 [Patescibacteria group bacterium]